MTSAFVVIRFWHIYRTGTLQAWIQSKPGTRPPIWWQLDAPREYLPCADCPNAAYAMRRQVSGPPLNFDHIRPLLMCGVPVPDEGQCLDGVEFESEAAFLKRHHLLLVPEESRLTADDFLPVRWQDVCRFKRT